MRANSPFCHKSKLKLAGSAFPYFKAEGTAGPAFFIGPHTNFYLGRIRMSAQRKIFPTLLNKFERGVLDQLSRETKMSRCHTSTAHRC
jgi:hypothetical protein